MFPLPFCQFTITTDRTPSDVLGRIRARIVLPTPAEATAFGIEAFFRRLEGQSTPQFFTGVVDEPRLAFRVSRFISYQNSFLPLLFGSVTLTGARTTVRVYARPSWFATAFTLVWLVGVSGALFDSGSSGFPWYVRFGMPSFAGVLYLGAFIPELVAARRALSRLIAPDPVPSGPDA
ncbi:hypothetical protein BAC2_01042 [uncultured bacterium]|nr:hypothetical protein BAC2_01042 [uncultured bacterium]